MENEVCGATMIQIEQDQLDKQLYEKERALKQHLGTMNDLSPQKTFNERLADKITQAEKSLSELKALQQLIAANPGFVDALKAFTQIGFY